MLLQYMVGVRMQKKLDMYGGGGMKKDKSSIWECNLSTGRIYIIAKAYVRL